MPWILGAFLFVGIDPTVLTVNLEVVPEIHATTTEDLIAIATSSARKYNLSKRQTERMLKVIDCESGWVATSTGRLGERGLVQIYPKYHPDITVSQMLDPYFSLEYIAREFSRKNYSPWSCYAMLFS